MTCAHMPYNMNNSFQNKNVDAVKNFWVTTLSWYYLARLLLKLPHFGFYHSASWNVLGEEGILPDSRAGIVWYEDHILYQMWLYPIPISPALTPNVNCVLICASSFRKKDVLENLRKWQVYQVYQVYQAYQLCPIWLGLPGLTAMSHLTRFTRFTRFTRYVQFD